MKRYTFKGNKLTENQNFMGDESRHVHIHKVCVAGYKETIVGLINDIVCKTCPTTLTANFDETSIIGFLNLVNINYVKSFQCPVFREPSTDKFEIQSEPEDLNSKVELNNLHFDKFREMSDKECLLSFYVGNIDPDFNWGNWISFYPHTNWIVDEYEETWDSFKFDGYRYQCSTLYNSHDGVVFATDGSFDDVHDLLRLHPVHFGKIRIDELRTEIEITRRRSEKPRGIKSSCDYERFSKHGKQTCMTYLGIADYEIENGKSEIRFIKSLWDKLNDELYGYENEDLSMRYIGIDRFSPLTDLSDINDCMGNN